MDILVTGGAGFIGSHLVEYLIQRGHTVTVLDNLSSGKMANLRSVAKAKALKVIVDDIKNQQTTIAAVEGKQLIFHFSDNSDIRFATTHAHTFLDQNILGLFYILEGMRKHDVKRIVFPSSTTVLGDAKTVPTPEAYGPLQPMNIYGGAKLACEGLLSAYCHSLDIKAWVFRFVDIVGSRIDHGVIYDFVRKLRANPHELEILGDGSQRRSFLLVEECVEAMWLAIRKLDSPVNLVHVGNKDQISIKEVARIVQSVMGLEEVRFNYTGGKRGWKGDAFTNFISNDSLEKLNWAPKADSGAAVREATRQILVGFQRE